MGKITSEKKFSHEIYGETFYIFNMEWLSDAFHFYGEKIFHKLLEFIRTVGINDLHDGNIGYIGNRPVLVDYSSFDS